MELPSVLVIRISVLFSLLTNFLLSLIPKEVRSSISLSHDRPNDGLNNTGSEKENHLSTLSSSPEVLQQCDDDLRRQVFEMFDGNGDGRISTKEMKQSLQKMGIFIPDTELIQMIQKVDVDGDGCLDLGEFEVLYQTIMEQQQQQQQQDHQENGDEDTTILNAFEVFDKNSDGFITVDELGSVLNSLGLWQGRNEDDCRKMIMKVDVDGDGMVSFQEFKTMMKDSQFSVFTT